MEIRQREHEEYTRKEMENDYFKGVVSILKKAKIKCSLDVGACVGEYTKVLIESIPTLETCIMVEPLVDNVNYITGRLNYDGKPLIHVYNNAMFYGKDVVGIGRINGDNINVGAGSVFLNRDSEIAHTIKLEDINYPIDFIKLDVEGAEVNIIDNSTRIKDIKFVEIEFHHYFEEVAQPEPRHKYIKKMFPKHTILLESERNILLKKL